MKVNRRIKWVEYLDPNVNQKIMKLHYNENEGSDYWKECYISLCFLRVILKISVLRFLYSYRSCRNYFVNLLRTWCENIESMKLNGNIRKKAIN